MECSLCLLGSKSNMDEMVRNASVVIVLVLRVSASVFCVCSDTDFSILFCIFFGFVMQLTLTEQRQNQFVYWRISR